MITQKSSIFNYNYESVHGSNYILEKPKDVEYSRSICPPNLFFFISYGLNLCPAWFLLFIVLNCDQDKMYLQCISHLHIFYSVQVQSTYGMSVFPVAMGIYNHLSTMLFVFSFRG